MSGLTSSAAQEVERQVLAAAERHREVLASMEEGGRPDVGQRAAVKAVGRSIALMALVLKRATESGVPIERLAELTTWDADLVRQVLERPPEPALVARVAPGLDPVAVARAAAGLEAAQRLTGLLDAVRADVDDASWSPAAADVDDLYDALESAWRSWRQSLQRA